MTTTLCADAARTAAIPAASSDSDEALMLRYSQTKCEAAYTLLYNRHYRPLVKYLTQYLSRHHLAHEAEDVAQQVLMNMARFHDLYQPGCCVRAWLNVMAKNTARGLVRHNRCRKRCGEIPNVPLENLEQPQIEEALAQDTGGQDWVQEYVEALEPDQQQLIWLVFWNRHSIREAARELKLPFSSAQRQLQQALATLRQKMKAA